jgi:hypothetical protein
LRHGHREYDSRDRAGRLIGWDVAELGRSDGLGPERQPAPACDGERHGLVAPAGYHVSIMVVAKYRGLTMKATTGFTPS